MAEFGIRGIDLMEHAARGAANVAAEIAKGLAAGTGTIVIVCGTGNNGGDGWAMGRLLHERGHDVHMVSPRASRPGSDAALNEQRTRGLGLSVHSDIKTCEPGHLVIDAVLGTGLEGPVSGVSLTLIEAINSMGAPVLAVDIPSGLDANTGSPCNVAVRAVATATFAGVKVGMLEPHARMFTGDVHVIDIGVPRKLAKALAVDSST